ncbi:MAG: hypothetical protein LBJ41_03565 [Treponema sp.]|jgi:hypothetical protein|nr:hypothetical protein [Treponema sp.]
MPFTLVECGHRTFHAPDSTVEYPKTETVTRNLRHIISDILIVINRVCAYHLEAQINNDEDIALRVFEYDWQAGLRSKTVCGNVITVKFPRSIVMYWKTTKNTPDVVTLRLEFPDGATYDYQVKRFKLLDYTIEGYHEKTSKRTPAGYPGAWRADVRRTVLVL